MCVDQEYGQALGEQRLTACRLEWRLRLGKELGRGLPGLPAGASWPAPPLLPPCFSYQAQLPLCSAARALQTSLVCVRLPVSCFIL